MLIFFLQKRRMPGLIAVGIGAVLCLLVYYIWVPVALRSALFELSRRRAEAPAPQGDPVFISSSWTSGLVLLTLTLRILAARKGFRMWSRRFRLLAGPEGPVCSGLRLAAMWGSPSGLPPGFCPASSKLTSTTAA